MIVQEKRCCFIALYTLRISSVTLYYRHVCVDKMDYSVCAILKDEANQGRNLTLTN